MLKLGKMQDIASRAVDMRAEVGCLTRNVLIQGDSESPVDQYGAHIMLHSPPSGDLATTTGRISHVECYRCGQVLLHSLGGFMQASRCLELQEGIHVKGMAH